MGLHQNSPLGLWFNALIRSATLRAVSSYTHEAHPLRRTVLLLVYPNTKYPWIFTIMQTPKFLLSSSPVPSFSSDGHTSHSSLPSKPLSTCLHLLPFISSTVSRVVPLPLFSAGEGRQEETSSSTSRISPLIWTWFTLQDLVPSTIKFAS